MARQHAERRRLQRREIQTGQGPGQSREANRSVTTQLPRPRVTERVVLTAVPRFSGGPARGPNGLPGLYEVVCILGIPGLASIATGLEVDKLLASGDSLLQGGDMQVDLETPEGEQRVVTLVPNQSGRLAQARLTIRARHFADAGKLAHDLVMPILSMLSFQADAPVETTAMVITEQATQIRRVEATVVGTVQPAPQLAWVSTRELRPLLAAYREGLNSNSPLHQAVSFYKAVDGAIALSKRRSRGGTSTPEPLSPVIPQTLAHLPPGTELALQRFTPYLGKTFDDVLTSVKGPIRDASLHLAPGQDHRIADYMDDLEACRQVVPILRYMARELISIAIRQSQGSETRCLY